MREMIIIFVGNRHCTEPDRKGYALVFLPSPKAEEPADGTEEERRGSRREDTEDRPVASDGSHQYSRNPWRGCCLGLAGHCYIDSHHTTGIYRSVS